MKKTTLGSAALLAALAMPAQAANWLVLQGTEPKDAGTSPRFWGFVQGEYQTTDGTTIPAGPWQGQKMFPNLIGPDKNSDDQWMFKRVRGGVRGKVPGAEQFNYALAVDAGDNGGTHYGKDDTPVQLIDASVTWSANSVVRVRAGQFKFPGSEEGLTPANRSHYINPSDVVNQLVGEAFFDGTGASTSDANYPNGPNNLYHDIGLQLFGVLPGGNGLWEHTYAVMVGDGNGVARGDNNGDKDVYLYWASERLFGGKGANRDGWKLSAWWTEGTRTLTTSGAGDYDRTRYGVGSVYKRGPWRVSGEYVWADGMIPNGTDGNAVPGSWDNAATQIASYNMLPTSEAEGWYLEGAYRPLTQLELGLRYDYLDRGTDSATTHRVFENWTLGAKYFINKTFTVSANYQWRSIDAPDLPSSHTVNQILAGVDDLVSVQLQADF